MSRLGSHASPISLKEGAIFVADVHYHRGVREEFIDFVDALLERPPTQLFLVGDIFDLLVGQIPSSITTNQALIDRLQKVGAVCECFYLEGNHDFNLSSIFPAIQCIPRSRQPLILQYGQRLVALSHGDRVEGIKYGLYATLIRQPFILKLLDLLNRNGRIVAAIESMNAKKDLCKRLESFDRVIEQKLRYYASVDLVIEGHYHQSIQRSTYINLPAFGCDRGYMVYEAGAFTFKQWRG